MINDYIRKDLKGFTPYHAAYEAYDIKLDANENPFTHKAEVIEQAKKWLEQKDNITRYPDTDSTEFRIKLAAVYGLDKENFICGVGSDQIIEYITKAFLEPGELLLAPEPSFSMYGISGRLNHGQVSYYALRNDFSYDIQALLEAYDRVKPKLLFVCTPNNPTGSRILRGELETILDRIKSPVIIDEAYTEYFDESMADAVNKYENLIVLRTFSKAYGIAGLRVGYAIGCKEVIEALNIVKAPYNLCAFSSYFAGLILDNRDYYLSLADRIIAQKQLVMQSLSELEIVETLYPSYANFILMTVKDMRLLDYLKDHRLLVRGYGDEGRLKNCIRITIGTDEENVRLIELMKAYMITDFN